MTLGFISVAYDCYPQRADTLSDGYDIQNHYLEDGLDALKDDAEMVSEAEISGEELLSHLQRLRKHPVNINSASRHQLRSTMLLTDFQIESILQSIKTGGAILSFAELSLLYGFNDREVNRIRPYFYLGPASRQRLGFAKDQSTSVFAKYQRGFAPETEQHLVRTGFSYLDWVDASLVYKGASSKSSSASFATGGVSCSGIKAGKIEVEKIVFGDFYARFGQGLSVWNGFSFSGAAETNGFVKSADGISLYSSSDTTHILRGLAATLSLGGFSLNAGYSFRNNSSVARLSYMGKRIRYAVSFSGYEKKNNVFAVDVLAGAKNLVLFAEVSCSVTKGGHSGKAAAVSGKAVAEESDFSGKAAAVSGKAAAEESDFSGKAEAEGNLLENIVNKGYAMLGGLSYDLENHSFHLIGRMYQNGFSSPLGGAYSSISRIENQQGVSLRITGPVWGKVKYAVGADYTAYPKPRYRVKSPSCTFKSYLKFTLDDSGFGSPARNQLWIKGYMKYDIEYSTPASKVAYYSLKAGGMLSLTRWLTLNSRAEVNTRHSSAYQEAEAENVGGKALSVFLKGNFLNGFLVASCGVIFYDARDWAGRIYFPQPELPYSFSSNLLYGQGADGWCTVKTRLSRSLSLYLKYQYNRGRTYVKSAISADF